MFILNFILIFILFLIVIGLIIWCFYFEFKIIMFDDYKRVKNFCSMD